MSINKKIIHEIHDDDLFRIVSGSEEDVIFDKLSEAAKFIYDKNIKHGDDKIHAQLVYYTYKKWRGWENKKQPKPQFFSDFDKYFTPSRDKEGKYYLLDSKSFDLSSEMYWEMRADIRHEKARKKKK